MLLLLARAQVQGKGKCSGRPCRAQAQGIKAVTAPSLRPGRATETCRRNTTRYRAGMLRGPAAPRRTGPVGSTIQSAMEACLVREGWACLLRVWGGAPRSVADIIPRNIKVHKMRRMLDCQAEAAHSLRRFTPCPCIINNHNSSSSSKEHMDRPSRSRIQDKGTTPAISSNYSSNSSRCSSSISRLGGQESTRGPLITASQEAATALSGRPTARSYLPRTPEQDRTTDQQEGHTVPTHPPSSARQLQHPDHQVEVRRIAARKDRSATRPRLLVRPAVRAARVSKLRRARG